jgi:hypothetical protein
MMVFREVISNVELQLQPIVLVVEEAVIVLSMTFPSPPMFANCPRITRNFGVPEPPLNALLTRTAQLEVFVKMLTADLVDAFL